MALAWGRSWLRLTASYLSASRISREAEMGFAPSGIGKLSELEIDVDKDWAGYLIKGLGAAVDDDDLLTRVQALLQSIFTGQGDVLYRNDTEGVKLDAGDSGRFLELIPTSPESIPAWREVF